MSTYINFNSAPTYYTPQSPTMTTQAVGEEGGGTATTMALGEEGGGSNTGGTITTMALGEEGGGSNAGGTVTTMALGEEGGGSNTGGTVTTMALGEEGGGSGPITSQIYGEEGGGVPTTMALGEEGGGYSADTRLYHQFLRDADKTSGPVSPSGPITQGPDGKLTRDEVNQQVQTYQTQLNALNQAAPILQFISQLFPQFASLVNYVKSQLEQKLAVGQKLADNFDKFARGGPVARTGDDVNTVSTQDIWCLAYLDGNPFNVSAQDLSRAEPPIPASSASLIAPNPDPNQLPLNPLA